MDISGCEQAGYCCHCSLGSIPARLPDCRWPGGAGWSQQSVEGQGAEGHGCCCCGALLRQQQVQPRARLGRQCRLSVKERQGHWGQMVPRGALLRSSRLERRHHRGPHWSRLPDVAQQPGFPLEQGSPARTRVGSGGRLQQLACALLLLGRCIPQGCHQAGNQCGVEQLWRGSAVLRCCSLQGFQGRPPHCRQVMLEQPGRQRGCGCRATACNGGSCNSCDCLAQLTLVQQLQGRQLLLHLTTKGGGQRRAGGTSQLLHSRNQARLAAPQLCHSLQLCRRRGVHLWQALQGPCVQVGGGFGCHWVAGNRSQDIAQQRRQCLRLQQVWHGLQQAAQQLQNAAGGGAQGQGVEAVAPVIGRRDAAAGALGDLGEQQVQVQ